MGIWRRGAHKQALNQPALIRTYTPILGRRCHVWSKPVDWPWIIMSIRLRD